MSFSKGFKDGLNAGLSKGMGPMGLLGVIFITMKLAGIGAVASWSWWWVLVPFWGPTALVLGLCLLIFIFAMTAIAIKSCLTNE